MELLSWDTKAIWFFSLKKGNLLFMEGSWFAIKKKPIHSNGAVGSRWVSVAITSLQQYLKT